MRTLLALEHPSGRFFILDQTKSAGSEIKRSVHFIKLNMMSIVPLIWMLMFNLFLQIAGC